MNDPEATPKPESVDEQQREAVLESSALFGVIDVSKLTEQDRLQVDMAARGCVSGRLYEWPHLGAAFERAGITRNPAMASDVMRDVCRLLLMISPNV